ncbi:hypothetical protein ABH935_009489 [Catenulispora sp. GAS73]
MRGAGAVCVCVWAVRCGAVRCGVLVLVPVPGLGFGGLPEVRLVCGLQAILYGFA